MNESKKCANKYQSVQQLHELGSPRHALAAGSLESQQHCGILPLDLCMPELAPQPIGAAPVLPESIALPRLAARVDRHLDQLVLAVREPALALVGAAPQFLKCLAELSLVLGGVGPRVEELLIALGGTVGLA